MNTKVGLLRIIFIAMIITTRRHSCTCLIIVLTLLPLLKLRCFRIQVLRNSLRYFCLIVGVSWVFRYTPGLFLSLRQYVRRVKSVDVCDPMTEY